MSKYRKGIGYIRRMKPTDKGNDFRTALRLGYYADPKVWKNPEQVKPVVMVQHGVPGVAAVWMNQDEAIKSLFGTREYRRRNARHNPQRGMRITKSDLRKVFRRWRFKDAK